MIEKVVITNADTGSTLIPKRADSSMSVSGRGKWICDIASVC